MRKAAVLEAPLLLNAPVSPNPPLPADTSCIKALRPQMSGCLPPGCHHAFGVCPLEGLCRAKVGEASAALFPPPRLRALANLAVEGSTPWWWQCGRC